ncbi:MAG: SdrD B-like domain-containing protein [Isosphaeraceae bacterium]
MKATTAELETITPAGPTLVTAATSAVTLGSSGTPTLSDTAVLSGGFLPDGLSSNINFTLTLGTTTVYTTSDTVSGNGTYGASYTLPTSGTLAGTYTWHAIYSGDADNTSASDEGGTAEQTVVSPASPTISTTPGGPVAIGNIVIGGTKYLDLTGNGFSSDDTPQSGVTIDLYKESDNTAGLQVGSGGDTLIATATTANNGTYSFSVTAAGTYYVQESVPSGSIQTGGGPDGSAGDTYYTINATAGNTYSDYDFDDYQIPTCTPTNVSYKVTTPNNCSTTVSNLAGNTQQGDTVTATFTVPAGMNDQLTLVSYIAPGPSFSDATAYEQEIYQQATGVFGPGTHTLSVQIPKDYYQIDFVCGQSINELEPNQNNDAYGPDSAEILYHAEDRFISSDNSGTTRPSLTTPIPTTDPTQTTTSTPTSALSDSATLSGGYDPTGTITFDLFAPGVTPDGTDSNAVYSDTVTISGDGTYTTTMPGSNPGGYVPTMPGTYEWVAIYGGDGNNNGAAGTLGSEPELVTAPTLQIAGTVYCDMNLDGTLDGCDEGISGVTVTLSGTEANGTSFSETTTTNSSGQYTFSGMPFSNSSGYTLTVSTPSGDFSDTATVGSLGGTAVSSPEEVTNIVMDTVGRTSGSGYNFGLVMPSSLSGVVYDDGKNDCKQDSCDQGLAGVTVTLTGTNFQGTSVSETAQTNSSGDYSFAGLAPGTYKVTVNPPSGFTADALTVGTVSGKTDGTGASNHASIGSIVLGGCSSAGIDYDFSLIGSNACSSQTQTCSYWCGPQGQSLINCLNGRSSCTNLGNWLASTCPNLFGSLKGCTNSQVATYCSTLAGGNANQRACAQVLSTALCVYVTDSNLAGGDYGSSCGFSVSENGLGASSCNVGNNGSALGLSNNQSCSVLALLSQIDAQSRNGSINSSACNAANSICSGINSI